MWPIIGHKRIIQFLENQIKNKTVSHAYLFLGPSSLGKFTTALLFAQTLLCQEENSCGRCLSCESFSKNLNSDLILIKNEGTPLSIETIRELRRQISLLPTLSKRRIVIFEEASCLTLEAQNALLKTLEEPPKYAVLILVAQKENLFPTILSRCARFYFQPVSFREIKEELKKRGLKEEEASFIAHLSLGQIGKVLGDDFFKQWQASFKSLLSLTSSSLKEKIDYAKNPQEEDLYFWMMILRDALFYKINPKLLLNYPQVHLENLSNLTAVFSVSELHSLLKKLQQTQELFKTSINQRLLLENLLLYL